MPNLSRKIRGGVIAAVAVAATVLAAPGAYASTTDLGTIDMGTSVPFFGVSTNNHSTVYDYTFTIASAAQGSVDVVASPIGGPSGSPAFSAMQMNVYSGTTTSGPLLASTNSSIDSSPLLHEYLNLANLNPGTYLIDIVATASAAHRAFAGTVSAVPLPAALPLFGGALMGMGFFSRRRARKESTAA